MARKMGIGLTEYIINNNENWERYKSLFVGKKKDDLADAFLQGLYYIKRVLKKDIGDNDNYK